MAEHPQGIKKRSVLLAGHRTSVSLEQAFWAELERIAEAQGISINKLIATVDRSRKGNLSSALRVYVVERLKAKSGK